METAGLVRLKYRFDRRSRTAPCRGPVRWLQAGQCPAVGSLSSQSDQPSARSQSLIKPRCKRPSRNACLPQNQPPKSAPRWIGAANTFRHPCTDGVSARTLPGWACGWSAPTRPTAGRRRTNWRFKIHKPLLMSTRQSWQVGICSRPRAP